MGNDDLQQFANKEAQKLKNELTPNLPNGEDLKEGWYRCCYGYNRANSILI